MYIYIYILGVPENGASPHIAVGKIVSATGGGATWAPPGVRMPGDAWCDPRIRVQLIWPYLTRYDYNNMIINTIYSASRPI